MKPGKNGIGKADLLSLDINGMVQDINEKKTSIEDDTLEQVASMEHEGVTSSEEDSNNSALTWLEGNEMWNTFMETCKEYKYREKKKGRKSYWIDDDIANTLKSCDINRMSVADIINAVLRSFISLNKETLRQFVEKKHTLI